MGCTTSCVAPTIADMNKSLTTGDERSMVLQLAACPKLLSTSTSAMFSIGNTPIHIACESKQVKVVQVILSFLNCSSLDAVREALQPYCRRAGKPLPATVTEGVRLAVDMENAKGQTPLMYACFADCPELVKLLLREGADPWVGDRCGRRTALHYAAMGGSPACIQALMKHIPPRLIVRQGVRYVDARSLCGLTPLHYCIYYRNLDALRELLAHFDPAINAATTSESYDVGVTCEARSAPLHFAAVIGSEEAAREVLRYYLERRGSGSVQGPIGDPRTRLNAANQMPWEVAFAHHPSSLSLAALLHPGQPLERVLGAGAGQGGAAAGGLGLGMGPPSLAAIAGAALRSKLLDDLRAIDSSSGTRDGDEAEVAAGASASADSEPQMGGAATGLCAEAAAAVAVASPVAGPVGCGTLRGRGDEGATSSSFSPTGTTSTTGTTTTTSQCHSPLPRCGRGGGRRSATVVPLPASTSPAAAPTSSSLAAAATVSASAGDSEIVRRTGAPGPWEATPSSRRPCGLLTAEGGGAVGSGAGRAENPEAGGRGKRPGEEAGRKGDAVEEDEDEEVSQCEVCFAARVAVAPAGCRHGLCGGCAERLCQGVSRRPLQCPFCRRVVTGFVKHSPGRG